MASTRPSWTSTLGDGSGGTTDGADSSGGAQADGQCSGRGRPGGQARLQGIDLTLFAVTRAVGAGDDGLDLDSSGDEAIIDIGAQVTSICVHDRGVTRFVRMSSSGGRDITPALASALGVDDEMAERLKRGERFDGIVRDAVPAVAAPPTELRPFPCRRQRMRRPSTHRPPTPRRSRRREASPAPADPTEVRDLALARAGSFADEVRSSLEFYAAQMPNAQVGRVLVVGEAPGRTACFRAAPGAPPVPVDRGRLLERAKSGDRAVQRTVRRRRGRVLAVAVGLAIPGWRSA